MATIKSFTSLEQSKKLAKILPIESADMYWDLLSNDKYAKVNNIGHCLGRTCVYAWSLTALLGVLPEGTRLLKSTNISSIGDTKYHCDCPKGNIDVWFDNPVDACVDMVIRLNELNLL